MKVQLRTYGIEASDSRELQKQLAAACSEQTNLLEIEAMISGEPTSWPEFAGQNRRPEKPGQIGATYPVVFSVILLAAFSTLRAERGLDPQYGRFAIAFEPNVGQAPALARYVGRAANYELIFRDDETVLQLKDPQDSTIRMKMPGASPDARFEVLEKLPGISNYYLGNDPTKWRTNVPQYSRLSRRDVYPGIDMVFYGSDGQLEYDCIVKPGADPSQIRMAYEGVEHLRADSNGDLLLTAGGRELRQKKPLVYQQNRDGEREAVSGSYKILESNNEVEFLFGDYDHTRTLVVDPALVYVAYLHGNGADTATGIAVDGNGNAYVTGRTISTKFPTASPAQPTYGGTGDAFVAKLNASGTAFVYSTYLGGSNGDDAMGIAVDTDGNAYVTGTTLSSDFPVKAALQGAKSGSENAFVSKLDASGTLVYSTYLGGSGSDVATAIAVDGSKNVYIAGSTSSLDFPVAHAIQPSLNGSQNSFVVKIDSKGSSLLFSTYLGGGTISGASGIALGLDGGVWITGAARLGFPTVNPIQQSFGGGTNTTDAFIAELDKSGSSLLFSTFLGGGGEDIATGITVDRFGNILVTGYTYSTDFPLVSPLQANLNNGQNAFVAKLSPNPPALVYSTYFSGAGAAGIAEDSSGNVTIVGQFPISFSSAYSNTFPLIYNLPLSSLPLTSAYAAEIDPTGSTLLYSTPLTDPNPAPGVPRLTAAFAVAADNAGNAYVAGDGAFVVKLISQPTFPCSIFVPRSPQSFPATGGTGAIIISYPPVGCGGQIPVFSTAGPQPAWLRYCPDCSGGGGVLRAIGFTVDANAGAARQASLLINGTGVTIKQAGSIPPPSKLGLIGFWDTPVTSTTASGDIAISGWALSSTPMSVRIYRNSVPGEQSPNGLIFIGNGTFVVGARPDVAAQHPEYSSSNNAGWSYNLLTNAFPNSDGSAGRGDGTYQLTVVLQDSTDQITFPARSIIVSNKNSSKPFGTIDTPAPGAVVSGNSYINFGWALTPPPFVIPLNGSTINVFLDGRPSGALMSYNNFRPDVAAVLPGYQNSNGAVGWRALDTTTLSTGQHAISWGITDSNNQTASAGNRIFTVRDGTTTAQPGENSTEAMPASSHPVRNPHASFSGEVMLRTGYDLKAPLEPLRPNRSRMYEIAVQQLDRLEVHLVDGDLNPVRCTADFRLPVGSKLEEEACIFYWQIDPSFMGVYPLVIASDLGDVRGRVIVTPKAPSNKLIE